MALKYELDSIEGLDEATASQYEKTDDGKYRLSLDGGPDIASYKNKVAEFRDNNLKLQKELSELKKASEDERKAREQAEMEAKQKAGDIEGTNEQWEKRYKELNAGWEAKFSATKEQNEKLTVGATAIRIASELDLASPDYLDGVQREVRRFLKTNEAGDGVVVVNEQGQQTGETLDELKKRITSTAWVKALLVGTGAAGGRGNTTVVSNGGGATNKKASEYSDKELSALRIDKPDEYKRILQELNLKKK
jgi:hypothetical protein